MAALLTGASQVEAAAAANVNERTLRRWLERHDVRDELTRRQRELLKRGIRALQSGFADAAHALIRIATGQLPEATQVQATAAARVVELAIRVAELADVLPRLEALEAEAALRASARKVP